MNSVSYRRITYKAAYNKGAPRFHTLNDSLLSVLLQSIPWTLMGAIPVALIGGIGMIVVDACVGDKTMNGLHYSYGRLFLCACVIGAYLIGFKACVKHLMTEQADNIYLLDVTRKFVFQRDASIMLGKHCVVDAPSFLKLLFSKDRGDTGGRSNSLL